MTNIFLKFDDLPGESLDQDHKHWIEVDGVDWALSAGEVDSFGRPRGGSHADFAVVKSLDKSSPILSLACVSGRHYPSAILEFTRRLGERSVVYHRISLSEVRVSGIAVEAASSMGSKPDPIAWREKLRLSFDEIVWEYYEVRHEHLRAPVKTKWSIRPGRPF